MGNYGSTVRVPMTVAGHTKALGSVVVAVVFACSACSGPAPTRVTVLRRQVQAIISSTDAALHRDQSVTPLEQSYQRYAGDFHRAAGRFRALGFPASMQHDAGDLVTALDTLASDAALVARAEATNQQIGANLTAEARAALTFTNEVAAEKSASDAVRRDVGLLPTTTATTRAAG